jgi:hypothetical protein
MHKFVKTNNPQGNEALVFIILVDEKDRPILEQ